MSYLFIALGLVLLFFGGEGILRGSVSLARKFGLSDFLIGAVVVGFGTSMPELSVSIKAALDGSTDIVLGNVVGSNIANVLLILGICAAICPILVADRSILRDALVVIGASLLLCLLALTGVIGFASGALLFGVLLVYLVFSYHQDKKKSATEKAETTSHIEDDAGGETLLSLPMALVYTFAGLAFLAGGATLLVQGATDIARSFGISEAIIGLSLVAIGTSLPELATGVVAALRRHTDIIIGNVLGSNLFNILCILGLSAMLSPLPVSAHIGTYDIWIMLAVAVLLAIALKTGHKISRTEGFLMIALYAAYMVWLYMAAA